VYVGVDDLVYVAVAVYVRVYVGEFACCVAVNVGVKDLVEVGVKVRVIVGVPVLVGVDVIVKVGVAAAEMSP
jgi:hypothetical protein